MLMWRNTASKVGRGGYLVAPSSANQVTSKGGAACGSPSTVWLLNPATTGCVEAVASSGGGGAGLLLYGTKGVRAIVTASCTMSWHLSLSNGCLSTGGMYLILISDTPIVERNCMWDYPGGGILKHLWTLVTPPTPAPQTPAPLACTAAENCSSHATDATLVVATANSNHPSSSSLSSVTSSTGGGAGGGGGGGGGVGELCRCTCRNAWSGADCSVCDERRFNASEDCGECAARARSSTAHHQSQHSDDNKFPNCTAIPPTASVTYSKSTTAPTTSLPSVASSTASSTASVITQASPSHTVSASPDHLQSSTKSLSTLSPTHTLFAHRMAFVAAMKRQQRSIDARVVMSQLVIGDGGTTGIVASGTTAALVSPTPSTPAQVSKLGALATAIICAFNDGEDDPQPSYFEVPLQVPIGTSSMRWFTGSVVLSSAVLVITPLSLLLGLQHYAYQHLKKEEEDKASSAGDSSSGSSEDGDVEDDIYKSTKRRKIESGSSKRLMAALANTSRVFLVSLAFIGPSILQCSVTAIRFSSSAVDRGMCLVFGVAPVLLAFAWVVRALALFTTTTEELPHSSSTTDSSDAEKEEEEEGKDLVAVVVRYATIETAVDCLRDAPPHQTLGMRQRLAFAFPVDVGAAMVMASAAGYRPSEPTDCVAVSSVCLCCALLYLAYLLLVRPYKSRLDTFFTGLVAVLTLTMSVAALVSLILLLQSNNDKNQNQADAGQDADVVEGRSREGGWAMRVFGYCSVGVMIVFPLQALVQLATHLADKHQKQRGTGDEDEAGEDGSGGIAARLLVPSRQQQQQQQPQQGEEEEEKVTSRTTKKKKNKGTVERRRRRNPLVRVDGDEEVEDAAPQPPAPGTYL